MSTSEINFDAVSLDEWDDVMERHDPERYALLDRTIAKMLMVHQLRTLTPPTPLIPTMFDYDTLALLYGKRGSYKSFLALDLALHVAYGMRWHTQPIDPCEVVYICAEGHHGLAQRIDAWQAHHGIHDDPTRLAIYAEAVNFTSPSQVGTFADACRYRAVKFVIIDTLARCTTGADENSSRDMGLALEQLDVLRRRTGACVLVVHHSGKAIDAGARGSSAIEAAADSVFEIGATDGLVTLKCTKQKHHAEGNPRYLRAVPVSESVVLDVNSAAGMDEWTAKDTDALRALDAIATPTGVSYTDWKATAAEAGVSEATLNRTRKKALDRAVIGLHPSGTDRAPRYVLTEAGHAHLHGDPQ